MNAMILAAGLGTRLGAIGAARPKILIEVGGEPLLARHLNYLWRNGIRRVVINLHHQAQSVVEFLDGYDGPVEVIPVHEPELLGTAGGVRNALPELQPGPFLIFYGDILVREPIEDMLADHVASDAAVTLAVHRAESAEGKGTVDVDEHGRVVRFAEKQGRGNQGPVLINSGIYVMDSEVVEPLAPHSFCDFGHDVFPRLLDEGGIVRIHELRSPVIDIGTPEGLALANATVASR
jgi:mannose-1-phosphate guanylyltransferase